MIALLSVDILMTCLKSLLGRAMSDIGQEHDQRILFLPQDVDLFLCASRDESDFQENTQINCTAYLAFVS